MNTSKTPSTFTITHSSFQFNKREVFIIKTPSKPTVMWKNIARRWISSNSKISSLTRTLSYLGFSNNSNSPEFRFKPLTELDSHSNMCFPGWGSHKIKDFSSGDEYLAGMLWLGGRKHANYNGSCCRNYATVAEAVEVSHTDLEEDSIPNVCAADEVRELLNEVRKEERRKYSLQWRRQRYVKGMGKGKYKALKRRQVKIETEAWVQAAKEYKELLNDMCEQKLAPNLPYMKSLFLGWFEPLRDKIDEEQEFIRKGKSKAGYAPYFFHLPADMMAVITMHKLMGLLMTGGEHGCARVVQAACIIGDAIEQEVGELRHLANTF